MDKEEFTLRQKWLPTFDDADEIANGLGLRQLFGRWARSLVLGSALIWTGYQGIGNNIEYSKGQKVGVVNKISEEGLFWETKEGQLSLEGRTSTGDYIGAGVWNFSIDKSAKRGENVNELYSQIEQGMDNSQRVKITYKEQFATWPWRADTTYLVQNIKPLKTKK